MQPADKRSTTGIGRKGKATGVVVISVSLKALGAVIDVPLLILKEEILTLFSMKDMLDEESDIPMQGRYVILDIISHPLAIKNCFLIHRCTPDGISFALYTEQKLRTLHRTFGHLSMQVLEMLLRWIDKPNTDVQTAKNLRNVEGDCSVCKEVPPGCRKFRLIVRT